MDAGSLPAWSTLIPAAGIGIVIGLSVMVRRHLGKPIFPKAPEDAIFVGRNASSDFTSGGLLVVMTNDTLNVVPQFPFNLMFLAEIYGLERKIPLKAITSLHWIGGIFGHSVLIYYGDTNRRLRLKLRDGDHLLNCIMTRRPDLAKI